MYDGVVQIGQDHRMARIYLITKDKLKAERLQSELSAEGHDVASDAIGERVRKQLLQKPPDVVVIDISRAPATGRDFGLFMRIQKATRHSLLIFLDGERDKVEEIRNLLPDALFTEQDRLIEVLAKGQRDQSAEPHVPESVFAGYAGRPLPAKLGIKAGMQVALLDVPETVLGSLDPLPVGVNFHRDLELRPDLCLWFARREQDLHECLPAILEQIKDAKLWILWPKRSSGVESDLTQQVVRKHGLETGWVDFKVCSFDQTWSGLCFTARKAK
jgi:CheY-like chemotaxis protein